MSESAEPTVMLPRSFRLPTLVAVDRLVHHSIILEFDGASRRVAKAAGKVSGKETIEASAPDMPQPPES